MTTKPAVKAAPHAIPTPAQAPTDRAGAVGTRVLVVEDEPLTAEVFARALQRAGHDVEVARDGLQALRRMQDHAPAIVVLDMSLPALSGVSVVRELRSCGFEDLPIVVVSGSRREDTSLRDDELQPGDWMLKPVKPRDLVARVQQLTDTQR